MIFLSLISIQQPSYGQDTLSGGRPEATVADDSSWYSQPWIWAVLVAILIVIIGFFNRKGNSTRKVKDDTDRGIR